MSGERAKVDVEGVESGDNGDEGEGHDDDTLRPHRAFGFVVLNVDLMPHLTIKFTIHATFLSTNYYIALILPSYFHHL